MIPKAGKEKILSDESFYLSQNILSYYGPMEIFEVLLERLKRMRGYAQLKLKELDLEKAAVSIVQGEEKTLSQRGAYHMNITPDHILIFSNTYEGCVNALTTLYWKLREGQGSCSCGYIEDSPAYLHRGFLLDCSRHFFGIDVVKSMIEQCALRKMNRIHWHLSDDQGYRIESLRFPRLNSVGSYRKEADGSLYGGYYTQKEIKEVVQYAGKRGVEIIPEIDIPGHVSVMIAAYPELACRKEAMEVPSMFGIHTRILCAGKDEVLVFVCELLDEVCALFPSKYFHIGGDEAPKEEWKNCPHCQKRRRQEGLANDEELQAWFTGKVLNHLQKCGKIGICWNEALKSDGLDESAVIQYWDEEGAGEDYCRRAFEHGRKCIYSYTPACYLDYIPAMVPLRQVFFSEPKVRCGNRIDESSLLGWEAALWSEQIPDRRQLERMAFPRIFALAEKAWNRNTEYDDFWKRCEQEVWWLTQDGISHFSMREADPGKEEQKEAIIAKWKPVVDSAVRAGMVRFVDSVCRLLRTKLTGLFTEEEIDTIIGAVCADLK